MGATHSESIPTDGTVKRLTIDCVSCVVAVETEQHFLLECNFYHQERENLFFPFGGIADVDEAQSTVPLRSTFLFWHGDCIRASRGSGSVGDCR